MGVPRPTFLARLLGHSMPQQNRPDQRAAMETMRNIPSTAATAALVAIILTALLLFKSPAFAQSDGQCGGVAITDPISVAQVAKTQQRLHFVNGGAAGRSECPGPHAACKAAAFLLPGDVVLTRPIQHKDHVCASFANSSGRETTGWLPSGALVGVEAKPVDEAGWLGTWRRTEAEIRITRGKSRGLHVVGTATYGAGSKARVASGAVNTGEIEGPARRSGDVMLVADEDIASFDAAPNDRCVARLRRIGPYLLVEDNNNCGGMNVSFSGLYVKR